MKDTQLIGMALGLESPWFVQDVDFDPEAKRLDIKLDFQRGGTFMCPSCERAGCKAYDKDWRTWRHLNFFQFESYLHAQLPRVDCSQCGVKTVEVPWARAGSGFTLLYEAFVLALAKEMPLAALARLFGEHDTRLWRIIEHHVHAALAERDLSVVKQVGVDETSRRRGHHYVSVFVDLERRETIHVCEGKDAATVESFTDALESHGGQAEQIEEICCDMSPAFISGVETQLPEAEITFDKYHVVALANKAVDAVRRQEIKDWPELKGSRWVWLKNPENLKEDQRTLLEALLLPAQSRKTARAYQLKLSLQDFYRQPRDCAETYLKKWYQWAIRCRLKPMQRFARTVKAHWHGILRWFESHITNGLLEAINSLIQAAKRKARGYRTTKNLMAIIYLITGNLKFNLPNYP